MRARDGSSASSSPRSTELPAPDGEKRKKAAFLLFSPTSKRASGTHLENFQDRYQVARAVDLCGLAVIIGRQHPRQRTVGILSPGRQLHRRARGGDPRADRGDGLALHPLQLVFEVLLRQIGGAALDRRGSRPHCGARLSDNAEGIRALRRTIIGNRHEQHWNVLLATADDFYSMSGCRDLFFNVMEHTFTVPDIAALLAEFGLSFLGFELDADVVE